MVNDDDKLLRLNSVNSFDIGEVMKVLMPYQLELKLTALLLFSIIAFIIGRLRQNNDLQKSLDKLNNSEYFKNELNKDLVITKKRMFSIKRIARIIIGIGIVALLGSVASLSKVVGQYLAIKWFLYMFIVVGVLYLLLEIYRRYLLRRERKETLSLSNIYAEEDKEVDKVLKAIGTKLADKLKNRLETIEK
jgi:membrane protein implicated in regulation of membrane protease activity